MTRPDAVLVEMTVQNQIVEDKNGPTKRKQRQNGREAFEHRAAFKISRSHASTPRVGARRFCFSNVVAPKRSLIANVEPAIGHHRIAPGLFHLVNSLRLVRWAKPAFLLVTRWPSLRQ